MDKTYKVYWSQTGKLTGKQVAYPPEVKEQLVSVEVENFEPNAEDGTSLICAWIELTVIFHLFFQKTRLDVAI